MVDRDLIMEQHTICIQNHPYSEHAKAPSGKQPMTSDAQIGDLVYIKSDLNKSGARDRYLVVQHDDTWCRVKKFTDRQLRPTSYKVRQDECIKVPSTVLQTQHPPAAPQGTYTELTPSLSDIPDTPNILLEPSTCDESPPEMVEEPQVVTHPLPNVMEEADNKPPPSPPVSQNEPRRSTRARMPPKYLGDFVLE